MRQTYDNVVAPHLHFLNSWVRRRVRPEDADDIVQETLLLALRHFGQFRFEANFSTWLCRIAINVIRGRVRRPYYRCTIFADSTVLESLNEWDPEMSQLAELEKRESKDRLYDAISRLPSGYQAVVELRDLRGLSIKKTAETLSLTQPAVKSRHYRARLRLLALLDK